MTIPRSHKLKQWNKIATYTIRVVSVYVVIQWRNSVESTSVQLQNLRPLRSIPGIIMKLTVKSEVKLLLDKAQNQQTCEIVRTNWF